MELFAAAGIPLPPSGGRNRASRALPRLRVPLFNYKVVQQARSLSAFSPTIQQAKAAGDYARKCRTAKFITLKETAVRPLFIQEILQKVLGYLAVDPEGPYTLDQERAIRLGAVDVALGRFNSDNGDDQIVAPFELKGPSYVDLDRIDAGRHRSPVQQAWDYAIDAPGSKWVLVSNCQEIRLYGFGRGRDAYELFDLTLLDDPEELTRLWLVLAETNLLGGATDALLRDTDSAYKDVTDDLYIQYKAMRERLITFLTDSSEGPRLANLDAIEPAQKILDRILFIAFAQRNGLLPDELLEQAAKEQNKFNPEPIWTNFLALFRMVDVGNNRLAIWAYNGGLFAVDAIVDTVVLPNDLAQDIAALGQWDYRREVPVTVLGHIFEQSITDIEKLKAESRGEIPPAVNKRKREGVVYTPDIVTRFLVERTIGLALEERRERLWREHGLEAGVPLESEQEIVCWNTYLLELRAFTIVDPACGSGAFLVAAFDEMARRYRAVQGRLLDLGVKPDFDFFDEIVTKNLYGVDLNAESVEITRLSLWLKTARRDHRLQSLAATIRCGNSLVEDPSLTDRPFDWRAAFPAVFAAGGFDIVIGNPPYVRMELLKPVKPYLALHFTVASDRADLYAYFFEKGATILKPGGRLGFISSSTFFRTGSGENLRRFLADGTAIESVVDFGDLQIFDGVTTYPAILTLRTEADAEGSLAFLEAKDRLPSDLGRAFLQSARPMPRHRLGSGSWRFEDEPLARLRDKIAQGRPTLGEVHGAPLRGIVTGLNDAFVIDRPTRERIVAADARSDTLLVPFLRGEDIKLWAVQSDDRFLINIAKGQIDIDAYPAIRDWLLPFRDSLEKRATRQKWWELQQAQSAYDPHFRARKIVWPHFQDKATFAAEPNGYFLNNKAFFIPSGNPRLLAFLNSRLAQAQLFSIANPKRGGYIEAEAQYVAQIALPCGVDEPWSDLGPLGTACAQAATDRTAIEAAVRHRILDLALPGRRKLSGKLDRWYTLDFATFRTAIKDTFHVEIPLRERGDWEAYLSENAACVQQLTERIKSAERQIDAIVYRLFDLSPDEIALLESSISSR